MVCTCMSDIRHAKGHICLYMFTLKNTSIAANCMPWKAKHARWTKTGYMTKRQHAYMLWRSSDSLLGATQATIRQQTLMAP